VQPILDWLQQNPSAVKAYMVSVLALISKVILAISGKTANLGPWTDIVNQVIDLSVGAATFYGLFIGTLHASRGPLLKPSEQAATIVAALKSPDVTIPVVPPPVTTRSF
jgi:hypothetical protein